VLDGTPPGRDLYRTTNAGHDQPISDIRGRSCTSTRKRKRPCTVSST
jgi:hypothetical protein